VVHSSMFALGCGSGAVGWGAMSVCNTAEPSVATVVAPCDCVLGRCKLRLFLSDAWGGNKHRVTVRAHYASMRPVQLVHAQSTITFITAITAVIAVLRYHCCTHTVVPGAGPKLTASLPRWAAAACAQLARSSVINCCCNCKTPFNGIYMYDVVWAHAVMPAFRHVDHATATAATTLHADRWPSAPLQLE
jgi:hypothetical protein